MNRMASNKETAVRRMKGSVQSSGYPKSSIDVLLLALGVYRNRCPLARFSCGSRGFGRRRAFSLNG